MLALDLRGRKLAERAMNLVDLVYDQVAAIKINRHLSIPLSLDELAKLVSGIHDRGLPAIMDCKVNDVASTSRLMADLFFDAGFDAITACPFTGWDGGLREVFDLARERGRDVILVVYMSHPGASLWYGGLFIDPEALCLTYPFEVFARQSVAWGACGVVVGATRPWVIERVARIVKNRALIFSPGLGPQGGLLEDSLKAGSDYLIVGRLIVEGSDPRGVAINLNRKIEDIMARIYGLSPKA
ncbi:MAG: orotidine 5'-phosphate decarboxylase [Candidatus Nezhaarchaeota archaeon]|nr:orotidine 5'-phosphate decarboxylase [Candidatus Nezhaarchaeota archaeon]